MTGSVSDAEDIVQDAYVGLTRAHQAGTTIADPKAYLTVVCLMTPGWLPGVGNEARPTSPTAELWG
jgi:hypothetical protein